MPMKLLIWITIPCFLCHHPVIINHVISSCFLPSCIFEQIIFRVEWIRQHSISSPQKWTISLKIHFWVNLRLVLNTSFWRNRNLWRLIALSDETDCKNSWEKCCEKYWENCSKCSCQTNAFASVYFTVRAIIVQGAQAFVIWIQVIFSGKYKKE